MNKKELEKLIIDLTRENYKLKEIINQKPQRKIVIDTRRCNFDESNLIKTLKKENEELRTRNNKLVNELLIVKHENKKFKKQKCRKEKTKEYKLFRKKILKRDNYKCTKCGCTENLQVHHIKSKKNYPELIMEPSNCITLCLICHSKTDSYLNSKYED